MKVKQFKSKNGADKSQIDTLRSLGLRRIGHTVEVKDNVGFEGGQMSIHMRMRKLRPHMKKSMPFEMFRTHTQV